MRALPAALLAAATLMAQPPAIRTGGVFNSASRTPSMLPGGGIARGALFEITGVRLGTSASTTSVAIAARAVELLAVSPQRIQCRMPVDAPLGEGALMVTVNGVSSAPYAVKVVRANFGIFSSNHQGWGPARIANSVRHAASPGESLILAGTGLGGARPEVLVGSRRATVLSVKRGRGGAPDEIAFRLPADTPRGCYVPLRVRMPDAAVSNTVTLSIRAGGGACEPPAILPAASWTGRTAGLVVLSRTARPPDSTSDEAYAVFVSQEDREPSLSPVLLIPPPGTCANYAGSFAGGPQLSGSPGEALTQSPRANGIDAGRRVYVAREKTRQPISPVPGAPGMYKRLLRGPSFLDPGMVVVGGEGGDAVGAFGVSLAAPEPFVWENRDASGTVSRAAGLALRWRPPSKNPEDAMLIAVRSIDAAPGVWGACYCAAAAVSGRFTIPAEMLATLPGGQGMVWMSYVPVANQQAIRATGLDHGLAMSVYVQAMEVQVR